MTITRYGMTLEAIEELIAQRVAKALATYEANHAAELVVKSQSQNGDDGDNGNSGGNGNVNGDRNGGGNGNENGEGNGNGNPNRNDRGAMLVTRECTYHDFVKCQPLNFKGTKGVVGLTSALTWWNTHKRTIEANATFSMSWRELMKLMTEDAIQIGNNLINRKLKGYAAKGVENKRRLDLTRKTIMYNNPLIRDKMLVDKMWQKPTRPVTMKEGDKLGLGLTTTNNRGNKAVNKENKARGKTYILGGGKANPDSNVITGTFLLNNRYASMLFDSGADRSLVSTTFSALLDVIPSILDVSYAVELADGRIGETNTVLRGHTLGLLGRPFNIELMPVELGCFNVIIGMDWLANHYAVIVCDEKIVRIPYGDKVLIVQGDRSGKGKKSKFSIISCTKTQKYIKKGCPVFLAQVTKKETEDKSEEKRLEDVPT
ncbi:reverse transcriptase domain-containing protein, partial [Tanacetum coccineum]